MKHYLYIFAVLFWYSILFVRYRLIFINLSFKHFESQYNGAGLGKTIATKSRKVYTTINVDAHQSICDIRNTVYHEYRHACQCKALDLVLLKRDDLFRNSAPKEAHDSFYFFSIQEIDARYFEQYKQWLELEEIPQKVLAREKRGYSYFLACMMTAAEYDVHNFPGEMTDQDILLKK